MDMNLSKLWGIMKDRVAWRAADHGAAKSQSDTTERMSNNHDNLNIM